ncbi:MAG: tail fiber domain-containing protein [Pseudomonadota bacterium]
MRKITMDRDHRVNTGFRIVFVWLAMTVAASSLQAQSEAMYLEGNLFLDSSAGAMLIGFPNNGNGWRLSTAGSGQDLLFRHSSSGSTSFVTRFRFSGDNGYLGVGGTLDPSARMTIYQDGQAVGRGLRFNDGTANQDWDMTHGFSLRLHYGGSLRGFFNANTGAYQQSSDLSLKEAIRPMSTVLSRVSLLEPSVYRVRGAEDDLDTIGFIAQDVIPVFPELVDYSEADDLYGVNYAGFSVVAIRAIQELQSELGERDRKISDLEQRLAAIEALLQE